MMLVNEWCLWYYLIYILFLIFFIQGLGLSEILVEVERRGSSFGELLAIPEQDDWIYSDGKSASCIAYVLGVYKEAGLFGSISDSIQITEFTVSSLRSDLVIGQ